MGECDIFCASRAVGDETGSGGTVVCGYLGSGGGVWGETDVETTGRCSRQLDMPPGSPRRAAEPTGGGGCGHGVTGGMKTTGVEKGVTEDGDSVVTGKKKIGAGGTGAEGLGLSKRSRRIERRARREKGMEMLVDLVKKVVLREKDVDQKVDRVRGRGARAAFGEWSAKKEEKGKEDKVNVKEEGDMEELRFLIEKCEIGKKKDAVDMFMPYIT